VDGALRHLGFPPPSPRELKSITLAVTDAAAGEELFRRWETAAKKGEAPDFTEDETIWFQELLNYGAACPGCGGLPGTFHEDGCPEDPQNWPEQAPAAGSAPIEDDPLIAGGRVSLG